MKYTFVNFRVTYILLHIIIRMHFEQLKLFSEHFFNLFLMRFFIQ